MTILVVDDNAVNLAVATGMLSQLGCASETAADGIEAVQAVIRRSYAAILMDCMMPRMDGCHATRAIRGHEQRRGLARQPIIGVSALAAAEDRAAALAAGMDAYLVKPLSQAALAAELQRFGVLAGRAEAPAAGPRSAILDPDVAANLRSLPGGLAAQLWLEFADGLPERLAEVADDDARGDLGAAQKHLHGLRGSAATLGLHALAQGLLACETALKRQDPAWRAAWDQVPALATEAITAARNAARG
jgi:CheY-like chemotaxis protein/HPt (histidine-containing phosphotransfer) domain-containing protein